eukprot:Em0005g1181a
MRTPADFSLQRGAITMIVICCLFVLLLGVGTAIDTATRRLNTVNRTGTKPIEDGIVNHDEKQAVRDTEVEENATLLDESKKKKRRLNVAPLLDLITAFSLHKTLPTIFSTHQPPNAIGCINPIRVISMFWIVTCHVYFFGISHFDNAVVVFDVIVKQLPFQVIVNGFFSVDTFFFLSGLLTSYLPPPNEQTKGQVSFGSILPSSILVTDSNLGICDVLLVVHGTPSLLECTRK